MTRLVVSTDASVLNDNSVGIGYAVERVEEDGEQVEMLVKECDDISPDCLDDHHETVHEAEYIAVVRGVEAAREHLEDERLVIRCDNGNIVTRIRAGSGIGDERVERFSESVEGVEWEIRQIPRILNSLADSLSKQASTDKIR